MRKRELQSRISLAGSPIERVGIDIAQLDPSSRGYRRSVS